MARVIHQTPGGGGGGGCGGGSMASDVDIHGSLRENG